MRSWKCVALQTNVVFTSAGQPSLQLNNEIMRLITYRTGGQVLPIAQSDMSSLFTELAASMQYTQLIYVRTIEVNGPTTSAHEV